MNELLVGADSIPVSDTCVFDLATLPNRFYLNIGMPRRLQASDHAKFDFTGVTL